MRKVSISLKTIIMSLLLSITASCVVFADGNVSITLDKESCAVSDEIRATVTADGGADAASKPEISIVYDPNRLSFIDCTAEYGGGGGGLITITDTTADISFTAVSGGEAEITVNAVFDGDGANPQGASATLMVDGEDTAAAMSGSSSSETGIEAGTVMSADGTKLVSSVFANEFMPVGFYKTTVTYEEQMVEAAQFDMADITLLYVTDADGNNGSFDIYNKETGEMSDFLQIMGIENRFIIALKAGEEVEVPEDFTKATLQWNDQVLEAYSYTGETGDLTVSPNEFFLIYAISSTGNKGFYMYDQNEGTYQRFVSGFHAGAKGGITENQGGILSAITSSSDKDSSETGLDIKLIIIGILALITVILLILFIVTLVKLKDYESYDYIDEDEEYEAAGMERGSQPSFVRTQATDNLPDLNEKSIREKKAESKENSEPEKPVDELRKPKKVTASDLVERDMAVKDDEEIDFSENVFDSRKSKTYEEEEVKAERPLSKAELRAEAKAAKKEAKRIKKQYGENGYVDWESFGDTVKKNETEAPKFEKNPKYVMDDVPARPKTNEKPEATESKEQQFVFRNKKEDYSELRSNEQRKENPAEMMKNIPANDNNRPVQPKPVQQYDLDEDFEFEFLKLDDD